MKLKLVHICALLAVLIAIPSMTAYAGNETEITQVEKNNVAIHYKTMEDGGIMVVEVNNKSDRRIMLRIDESVLVVEANRSMLTNKCAWKRVRFDSRGGAGGATLWAYIEPKKTEPVIPIVDETEPGNSEAPGEKDAAVAVDTGGKSAVKNKRRANKPAPAPTVSYAEQMNQDPFFGREAVKEYIQKVDRLCRSLELSKNKPQFIIDNDIIPFLEQSEIEINEKKSDLALIAQEIVRKSDVEPSRQSSILDLIAESLNVRLKTREEAYNKLLSAVASANEPADLSVGLNDEIVNYGIVGAVIAVFAILVIAALRKKGGNNKVASQNTQDTTVHEAVGDNPAIVVRRKTTSILKKQCIDDVVGNPSYMLIASSEFTQDSAVRNIYIKNSCIKDVFNLYAEDLRNSENPKEDGCMVLGRWVHDETDNTYDISLEEAVFPGDDAVFKEYELNFGGKIKLRVAEKLRKLRRDTNMQYDLVCWIHSHPGLGVFFSNYDDTVQMQLKHPQHPNFLIAFVVDILTPEQETGIFTFRKDGSMNSKGDITKMYSLEEMYKWALQSERTSFNPENYYNVLGNAKLKMPTCMGVELNNSSIIDLTQIVIEPETGIVGWVIGTTVENKTGQEFVVSSIVRDAEKPATGIIGCLISMMHMSFPTIQRHIANESRTISFVMVYSHKQMSLTTIPVINGEMLTDERFCDDVNIDDLKIWTRRKR